MAKWIDFPYRGEFSYDAASVKKQWKKLHTGDLEPCPENGTVLQAWAHYHNGDFQQAAELGLTAGAAGITVANKAACIYANGLETKEKVKLDLFIEAANRAEKQATAEPGNANAHYLQALALGRYGRGISVAKALAQGLGTKVKAALEKAIALQPDHADAHIALGAFHAEVIDKVGSLIGGMTYGVKKDTGLKLLQRAMALHPTSAIAMTEYADALVMLEGDKRMKEATQLYEKAAACTPLDAMERLDIEMAKSELE